MSPAGGRLWSLIAVVGTICHTVDCSLKDDHLEVVQGQPPQRAIVRRRLQDAVVKSSGHLERLDASKGWQGPRMKVQMNSDGELFTLGPELALLSADESRGSLVEKSRNRQIEDPAPAPAPKGMSMKDLKKFQESEQEKKSLQAEKDSEQSAKRGQRMEGAENGMAANQRAKTEGLDAMQEEAFAQEEYKSGQKDCEIGRRRKEACLKAKWVQVKYTKLSKGDYRGGRCKGDPVAPANLGTWETEKKCKQACREDTQLNCVYFVYNRRNGECTQFEECDDLEGMSETGDEMFVSWQLDVKDQTDLKDECLREADDLIAQCNADKEAAKQDYKNGEANLEQAQDNAQVAQEDAYKTSSMREAPLD